MNLVFTPFPKMARLSREVTVTEKIDGTNASIFVGPEGEFLIGSRTRWITPESDNYGFARWAHEHKEELLKLGPGHHFGEFWGAGIKRRYGLTEKRFSLFNAGRWVTEKGIEGVLDMNNSLADGPNCCHVVPVLYRGLFDTRAVQDCIDGLARAGSAAAPGFRDPEGIVVYHEAGKVGFKKTLNGDAAKCSANFVR